MNTQKLNATSNSANDINSEINNLLAELDEERLNEILSPEEIIKLRKDLNPYGRTIQGADKILTFSYTDLRKEYMLKLLTTTIIGFLNRACDEWHVPDGMVPIPIYEYLKNPALLEQMSSKVPEKDRVENTKWMEKRIIVKEFLEDMFQFNPDKHVRSAYRPNPDDPQRKEVLDTPAANLAIKTTSKFDHEFADRITAATKAGGKRIPQKKSAWHTATKITKDPSKKDDTLQENTTEMIPPEDLYHRLRYYYDSNYEELRHVVEMLYCEKPDLETAINPYDWHNSRDEADAFINKHKNEVIAPIYPGYSGKWNFIGPFKQVRDSVRYYNENTIVLEEIMKQREIDEKLGKDLMKKRIKVKKQQNIKEAGPDDEAFVAWAKQNSSLKGIADKNEDECPDNAVEVDIFRVSQVKQNVEKTKFYTQAEAPKDIAELAKEAIDAKKSTDLVDTIAQTAKP